MFEKLEFQGRLWRVCAKVDGSLVENPSTLKENYRCDMVIRNNQNVYFILNEIIDAEPTGDHLYDAAQDERNHESDIVLDGRDGDHARLFVFER